MAGRVAVIAVHGVGSPPRDETARAVAELLMQHAPADVRYEWNEERRITIETSPISAGPARERGSLSQQFLRAFTPRAGDRTKLDATKETAERPDIAFMRELLRDYHSAHEPYQTIETVGVRHASGGDTQVHVFEMHWADLSRLGSGLVRLVGAAYQLVQHISQLGRKNVDIAAQVARAREKQQLPANAPGPDAGPYRAWAAYGWMHSWAIRIFTVLVPIAAMLMLAFVPLFVPAAISVSARIHVGITAVALILVVLGGIGIYRAPPDRWAATIFVGYMLAVVTAALVLSNNPPIDPTRFGTMLFSIALAVVSFGGMFAFLARYNQNRSGALLFGVISFIGIITGIVASARALVGSFDLRDAEQVRDLALIGFEWGYALLMVTWGLLWVAVALTLGFRFALWLQTSGKARVRATRAMWTARVTLGAAVFSFMVAALVVYRSVVYLGSKTRGSFDLFPRPLASGELPMIPVRPIFSHGFSCAAYAPGACSERFFLALIAQGGTSGFVIAVLGLILVLVLISWFVALIAFTSVHTPNPAKWSGRRLGLWMTDGFRWLRVAGTILAFTVLFAVLFGALVDLSPSLHAFVTAYAWRWLATRMTPEWTLGVIDTLTFAVLASAATAGAARLRLEALASRARPALGVILDVDNYLRETPFEGTPRARIAERFVSLLRHVRESRFDRVVLVTHSQGTVITADLLRFLHYGLPKGSADRELTAADRCRLMTMGSPLRQLYGANFPHLYGWVNASDPLPDDAHEPLATMELPTIAARSPDPDELRVECWVNLYTSGDYVGRNLWSDDDWHDIWDRREMQAAIEGGRRRERCLGAGTHTHYWESADVAEELDRLVAVAELGPASGGEYRPADRGRRRVGGRG
jgi:hypothetical protein